MDQNDNSQPKDDIDNKSYKHSSSSQYIGTLETVEEHLKDYESLMKYTLKLLDDNKTLMEENLSMKKENQELLQENINLMSENEKFKTEKEKLIDDSLVLIEYNETLREEKNHLEKELVEIKAKFEIILDTLSNEPLDVPKAEKST